MRCPFSKRISAVVGFSRVTALMGVDDAVVFAYAEVEKPVSKTKATSSCVRIEYRRIVFISWYVYHGLFLLS